MTMKSLLSAAHAAGYAMAPSEEQFHAPDGGTTRVFTNRDISAREALARSNVPALPSPKSPEMADGWLRSMIGSVLPRRATA